jgi:hypothetical protein
MGMPLRGTQVVKRGVWFVGAVIVSDLWSEKKLRAEME